MNTTVLVLHALKKLDIAPTEMDFSDLGYDALLDAAVALAQAGNQVAPDGHRIVCEDRRTA